MKGLRPIVLILLFAIPAWAEDPLQTAGALLSASQHAHRSDAVPQTLEELEQTAMIGNPRIREAVRRLSVVEARAPGAGALDDPMFMYRDWGTPLRQPWNLNQSQQMFMFSQTFPGPGKRGLRSDVANKDVEIAKSELEAVRRDVRAGVRKAFYELLRNYEEVRIHDQQVAIANQGLQAARIKYVVGKVPQQDVLKAQVALTKLAEHLISLDEDGELARANLNTLLGRNPGQALEVMGQYSTPATLQPLAELEKIALEKRPELAAITSAMEQAERNRRLAAKGYTPDYTISAGYMLMPEGTQPARNTYMAEFSLNLPWLNRRKHDAEINAAKAVISERESEADNVRSQVFSQIQEALIRARAAQRTLALYRDTLRPQAEATLQATLAAYKNDKIDFLNLLDSQNMTLDVQSGYFKAAAEFESRLAELELAVGAPIPRDNPRMQSSLEVER